MIDVVANMDTNRNKGELCMHRQKFTFIIALHIALIIVYGYIFYIAWSLVTGHNWYQRHRPFIDKVEGLLGKPEGEVVKVLGSPLYIIYARDLKTNVDITRKYPATQGYARPGRAITNKALVYIKGDAIFYIYIDHKGFVEYVFYGPS